MFKSYGKNYCTYTTISPHLWLRLAKNCRKQRMEQSKIRAKIFTQVSPIELSYVDNVILAKKYAKTVKEKKTAAIMEKIFGKGELPSKDRVSDDVGISVSDFNIAMDKKEYFKVRDCIISSGRKLEKIVRCGRKQ